MEIELKVWETPVEEKKKVFPDAAFHLLGISTVKYRIFLRIWNENNMFSSLMVNGCIGHVPLNSLPEGAWIWLSFLDRLLVAKRVCNGWSLFSFVSGMLIVHFTALQCVYFTLSLHLAQANTAITPVLYFLYLSSP